MTITRMEGRKAVSSLGFSCPIISWCQLSRHLQHSEAPPDDISTAVNTHIYLPMSCCLLWQANFGTYILYHNATTVFGSKKPLHRRPCLSWKLRKEFLWSWRQGSNLAIPGDISARVINEVLPTTAGSDAI